MIRNIESASVVDDHVSPRQIAIVAMVIATLILDGLDVQLLSFVAPTIIAEWHVDKATFAPALAAALVGMAVGTGGGGWLGDRLGRKPVLIFSACLFGVATAGSGLTYDVATLAAVRFVSGLGFGAAYPNGLALVTESLPVGARTRAIGILSVSAPLGGMIGAAGSLVLLDRVGWRGTFGLCGLLALLLGAIMVVALSESPAFRRRNSASDDIVVHPGTMLAASGDVPCSAAGSIFTRHLLRLNVGAGGSFFAIAFASYAISSWMPTVLVGVGLPLADGLTGSLLYNSFSIAGSISTAWLIPRFGSRTMLASACTSSLLLLIVATLAIRNPELAHGGVARLVLLGAIGLSGGTIGGAIATIYAILSAGYPADRRSTGVGFGLMAGRTGGIITVLFGGALLTIGGSGATPFFAASLTALAVALVLAMVIDRHVAASPRRR